MAHVYGEHLACGGKIIDYLWARFARIYPLHLVCLGLVVIIAFTYPHFVPNVKDGSWQTFMAWRAIPSNLLLTHAMNQHVYLSWDIVSWSIGAEWWTYIATFVLVISLHKGPAWGGFAGMFVGFGLLTALVYVLPAHNLDITFNWGFFRCLFEIIIGLSVYRIYREGGFSWTRHDGVVLALLAAVAITFHFRLNDLVVVPVFCLLILGISRNTGKVHHLLRTGPLQYLGNVSYSLYLVHGVVFSAFWFLLPWIKTTHGVFNATERVAYAATFTVVVLGVSTLTYRFVERPARLWLLSFRRETSQRHHV